MSRKLVAYCALAGGLLLAAGAAFAHHGTSLTYDPTKLVTNSGTVTRFVWANPHGRLNWEVKDPSGKVVEWGGELHSIGLMSRAGWNRTFVKPGDQVTVSGRPARAGTPYMIVTEVVLNGRSYFRDLPEQGAGVN